MIKNKVIFTRKEIITLLREKKRYDNFFKQLWQEQLFIIKWINN